VTSQLAVRLAMACWAAQAFAQVNVPTVNYDLNRTSANLKRDDPSAGHRQGRHVRNAVRLPRGRPDLRPPLYVSQLSVGGQTRNVLYVATMHNTLYAFDADQPPQTALEWSRNFGPPVPNSFYGF